MFFKRYLVAGTLAICALAFVTPFGQAQAAGASAADDAFQALREASRKKDLATVEILAERLRDYDIPSYVDYYRLKPRIADLPDAEIRAYLERYAGSAIADRLRNDWLLQLGKARDWATFDQQFPLFVLQDDTQLKCYALMSAVLKGQNAAEGARALQS